MSEETPKLPPIPELTVLRANQLMCADNLRAIAKLIEMGSVTAFDFAWSHDLRKPQGKLVVNSTFLIAPVEAQFMTDVAEYQKNQFEDKIQLQDLSAELAEKHPPCDEEDRDDCSVCTRKGS